MEPEDAKNEPPVNPDTTTGNGDTPEMTTEIKVVDPKRKTRREWVPTFLARLKQTGNVRKACRAAGISTKTAYVHHQRREAFRKAWANALDTWVDSLEAAAVKRGRDGVDEPIYQGGKLVGYKRRYSDVLLIKALQAFRPERWGESKKIEHSGTTTQVEVQVDATGLPHGLTQADIDSARSLLAQMESKLPRVIDGNEPDALPPG